MACPVCKKNELTLKYPEGNATYYNNYLNEEHRKEIYGLSYCECFKKLISRGEQSAIV